MSRRASGIILFVLSFPLLMLGITAWREAAHEADVRAWQLEQAAETSDPAEAERFSSYAESTLWRQEDAEHSRNLMLAAAAAGVLGGVVVLATGGRRRDTDLVRAAAAAGAAPQPPTPRFTECAACGRQLSVAALACPQCGHPNEPVTTAPAATRVATAPAAQVNRAQQAFYAVLITLGLGSAVVIYTVLFDDLSETELVRISPFWLFPAVFGYYGLVAQRMEAKLRSTRLETVSDQLLSVIKETGMLGQVFAFLLHAPFLLVKSSRPWVTALVGSLIWAMALAAFFELIFPTL